MAKKHHGKVSAHAAHPHRDPGGMNDTMRTGHQHEHHQAINHPLPTFGEDACYEGGSSDHHLGNNECEED